MKITGEWHRKLWRPLGNKQLPRVSDSDLRITRDYNTDSTTYFPRTLKGVQYLMFIELCQLPDRTLPIPIPEFDQRE